MQESSFFQAAFKKAIDHYQRNKLTTDKLTVTSSQRKILTQGSDIFFIEGISQEGNQTQCLNLIYGSQII
jgi:hypothetical protein